MDRLNDDIRITEINSLKTHRRRKWKHTSFRDERSYYYWCSYEEHFKVYSALRNHAAKYIKQ